MDGIIIFGIIALVAGLVLSIIDYKLNNDDQKISQLVELLPGLNCGACGFGSCKGMAEAILKDRSEVHKCRPLRDKSKILEYIEKM